MSENLKVGVNMPTAPCSAQTETSQPQVQPNNNIPIPVGEFGTYVTIPVSQAPAEQKHETAKTIPTEDIVQSTEPQITDLKEQPQEQGWWDKLWSNKGCKDGSDDGKISFLAKATSFGKGLCSIVKSGAEVVSKGVGFVASNLLKHPIATIGCGALIAATAGTILATASPFLVAAGIVGGLATFGCGAYKAATAKTDAEARQAWENMGTGICSTALSVFSSGTALNLGKIGGATTQTAKFSNLTNTLNCFKATPKSLSLATGKSIQLAKKGWQAGKFAYNCANSLICGGNKILQGIGTGIDYCKSAINTINTFSSNINKVAKFGKIFRMAT